MKFAIYHICNENINICSEPSDNWIKVWDDAEVLGFVVCDREITRLKEHYEIRRVEV